MQRVKNSSIWRDSTCDDHDADQDGASSDHYAFLHSALTSNVDGNRCVPNNSASEHTPQTYGKATEVNGCSPRTMHYKMPSGEPSSGLASKPLQCLTASTMREPSGTPMTTTAT